MQTRLIELMVGAFMVLGVAALIFLGLKVSGLTFAPKEKTYTVAAKFENVGGLTLHAKVTLAGVYIGSVNKIILDSEDYTGRVEMSIRSDIKLSTDTTASILTAGLLGEKYIGLSVGAEEAYLKEGDIIHDTQSALVLEELIGSFLATKAR